MPSISPIIVTADLDRLRAFYGELLGATETARYPDEGSPFFVSLSFGDSELGLVSDEKVAPGTAGRVLLSIDVPDVDRALPRVGELGGNSAGPANDMPWGQRVAHITDPDGNSVNLTQAI